MTGVAGTGSGGHVAVRTAVLDLLEEAARTGAGTQPPSVAFPGFTADDAYAVQLAWVARRQAEGRTVRGHKVGLTSAAMQRMLGVNQPDYGHLLDDFFHPDHGRVDTGRFLALRVEPETAFILGAPLRGPGVTLAQAVAAVAFVAPALELVDSRVRDWKISFVDTVADNGSSGAVVLGAPVPLAAAGDLRTLGCNLIRNGGIAGTGAAGAVLGHPLNALVWLANTLGERGAGLDAGHVVLPGACTAAVPVAAGDTVAAVFARIGTVTVSFARGGGAR